MEGSSARELTLVYTAAKGKGGKAGGRRFIICIEHDAVVTESDGSDGTAHFSTSLRKKATGLEEVRPSNFQ